jgi:hypothetical protein
VLLWKDQVVLWKERLPTSELSSYRCFVLQPPELQQRMWLGWRRGLCRRLCRCVCVCVHVLISVSSFKPATAIEWKQTHHLQHETFSWSSPLSPHLEKTLLSLENYFSSNSALYQQTGKYSFYFSKWMILGDRRKWAREKSEYQEIRKVRRHPIHTYNFKLTSIITVSLE